MLAFAERQLARIRWGRGDVADFLGRYLSAPKPNVVFASNRGYSGSIKGKTIVLHPKTQMHYLGDRIFINGEVLRPARLAQRRALAALADQRCAPGRALARAGLERLILQWHQAGFLLLRADP